MAGNEKMKKGWRHRKKGWFKDFNMIARAAGAKVVLGMGGQWWWPPYGRNMAGAESIVRALGGHWSSMIQVFYTHEAYATRCTWKLEKLERLEDRIANRIATKGGTKNKHGKNYLKRVLISLKKEIAKRAA